VPLVTWVTLEIVEPSDGLIYLFMPSCIASRPHRRLDDRQVFIESIPGKDLVVTGIGHRSASDFGMPSRTSPDHPDRRSLDRRVRVGIEIIRSDKKTDELSSFFPDSCRYIIPGETQSVQNVVESPGRIAAHNGAPRMTRCGV